MEGNEDQFKKEEITGSVIHYIEIKEKPDDITNNMNGNDTCKTIRQKFKNETEYDQFLLTEKKGTFSRIGKFQGYSKAILHRCNDPQCLREWSPSPSQCLADDYYCPSCVLHHRNNMERFDIERLKWTAAVPNTFYVYEVVDPKTNQTVIKFGRTQHRDANKRYSLKERKKYKMKLKFYLRGRLRTMTQIENFWKDEAKAENAFIRFSDETFHGLTETIKNVKELIDRLIAESNKIASNDMKI